MQSDYTSSFPILIFRLLPPLLHSQDLHHPYEDIQEVELEADTLIHHILPRLAPLRQSGMMQDLLRVIEREASENRQATIQPDALAPHQGPGGRGGQDKRCETTHGD